MWGHPGTEISITILWVHLRGVESQTLENWVLSDDRHPVICSHIRRGLQCPPKVQLLSIWSSGWRCTEVEVGPSDSGPGGTDSSFCGWVLCKESHSLPLAMRRATLLWDVTATMSLKGNQVNQPWTEKEINLFPFRVIISVTLIESWQVG